MRKLPIAFAGGRSSRRAFLDQERTAARLGRSLALLTVSSLLEDYCGISDVCISVPCLMGRHGVGATLPLPYSEPELAALQHSAELLKATARQTGF